MKNKVENSALTIHLEPPNDQMGGKRTMGTGIHFIGQNDKELMKLDHL